MKTKKVVETEMERLLKSDFLYVRPEGDRDGYFVSDSDEDAIIMASKDLKISVEAVKAISESLKFFAEELVENLSKDLEDIWDKLEN